jgi:hypothetical protein
LRVENLVTILCSHRILIPYSGMYYSSQELTAHQGMPYFVRIGVWLLLSMIS